MLDPQASRFWQSTLLSGLMDVQALTACWEANSPAKREAAEHIEGTWGKAYPEEMWPDLLFSDSGLDSHTYTRITAGMARHVVRAIVKELRELENGKVRL